MSRVLAAACAVLFASFSVRAAEPKPLWELPVTVGGEQAAAPAWISYSPDGRSIVAVTVRTTVPSDPTFTYHLRVWDAATRKERFNAALGSSKSFHWGDDLAAFPTDDSVMTGGPMTTVRNLENGSQTQSFPGSGLSDYAVWAVPDLKESYFLRRDGQRFGEPIELGFRTQNVNVYNEFGGRGGFGGKMIRGGGNNGHENATVEPPREGLQAEVVAMNAGRTHIAVSFRDSGKMQTPGVTRLRHSLAIYRIKTVEDFSLDLLTEANDPHAGPITAIAFARNGRILATGAEDGSINLWRIQSDGLSRIMPVSTGAGYRVYALAFSNDWRYLAAVTWDKTKPNLLLIDVDTGRVVRSIRQERQLTNVAWEPEGQTLLTGGASGTIKAWDAAALLKGN